MNQTWENGKKTNFESDFGPLGQNLGSQISFVDFVSTSSQTLFEAIIVCNLKEN